MGDLGDRDRMPFQVLVIPYRRIATRIRYAAFLRTDTSVWQFIAAGGSRGEDKDQAARREAHEEAGMLRGECRRPADQIVAGTLTRRVAILPGLREAPALGVQPGSTARVAQATWPRMLITSHLGGTLAESGCCRSGCRQNVARHVCGPLAMRTAVGGAKWLPSTSVSASAYRSTNSRRVRAASSGSRHAREDRCGSAIWNG